MKNILSALVAVVAVSGGSVIAGEGPTPLSLTQLDSVSAAGTEAYSSGNTHLSASLYDYSYCYCHNGYDLDVNISNHNSAYAHGYTVESASAYQGSAIEAGSIGGYPIWAASGSQMSEASAASIYYPYIAVY